MSKRKDLDLDEKLEILEKFDALGGNVSQRRAAVKLGIPQPTLSKILKNREKLAADKLSNVNPARKRQRTGTDPKVDGALRDWFCQVRSKDAMVDGPLLKAKAKEFAEKLGNDGFTASDGWFSRWKKRENICYSKMHGEAGSADMTAASNWMDTVWPKFQEEYEAENIYNADETALYYRALPEHTYIFKSEKEVRGFKKLKERITLLCCVSMTGERKGLLAIGKHKSPHCFKNVKKLPLEYTHSKNAWMTANLFSDWLLGWETELRKQNKKILLLVDNCKPHLSLPPLKNIKVVFLPANTTSVIQPCDQGIIRSFKSYYRQEVSRTILSQLDNGDSNSNQLAKKISLLQAFHMATKAWNQVSDKTIRNCFRKGGFISGDVEAEDARNFYLPPHLLEQQFEEWNSVDDNVETAGELLDEDILADYLDENPVDDHSEVESDDDSSSVRIPTNKEMLNALEVLKAGVLSLSAEFQIQYDYENFILNLVNKNKKQTTIDTYFKKK